MPKIELGTVLEPVLGPMLEPEPGTGTKTGMGMGMGMGPLTVLGTVLEMVMVRKVLEPLPELVPGQGTVLETMPEMEMEMETETEQGNKCSVLHP